MPLALGEETCANCGGTGRVFGSRRGGTGEPAYVPTEESCIACFGTGKVRVFVTPEDKSIKSAQRTAYSKPSTPEDADEGFAKLIILAAGAYTAYLVFGGSWGASPWEKWLLIGASMAVPWWLFRSFPRLARFLRYATISAIVLGVIWFFAR